jgi:peptide deformylase
MARLAILEYPDPRLRIRAEPVTEFGTEVQQLVADMFETALDEEGVGLAAPQIGVNLNLAVIDCSCGEDPTQQIILINPEIVREEGLQRGPEGCLSIPGIHEVLERPKQVWIRNRRPDGTWTELEGEDLLARAFCHEIDHLRGRLFVEYFGPVKRQVIQRKYQKLHK